MKIKCKGLSAVLYKVVLVSFLVTSLYFLYQISKVSSLPSKYDYLRYIGQNVDLTEAWSEYQLCNPTNEDFRISSKSRDYFNWHFNEVKGKIKESWFEKGVNESYIEIVNNYTNVCKPYQIILENGTVVNMHNCTMLNFPYQVEKWILAWNKFDPIGDTVKVGECFNFRIYGTYEPAYGENGIRIDNVIEFAGFNYDEYNWWNETWGARKPIKATETLSIKRINEFQEIWLNTSGAHAIQNCSREVRYVNASDNQPLPRDVVRDLAPNCSILINYTAEESATNDVIGYFYYNNSQATLPSYDTDLTISGSSPAMIVNSSKISYYTEQDSGCNAPFILRDVKDFRRTDYRSLLKTAGTQSGQFNFDSEVIMEDGALRKAINGSYATRDFWVKIELYSNKNWLRRIHYYSGSGTGLTTNLFWDTATNAGYPLGLHHCYYYGDDDIVHKMTTVCGNYSKDVKSEYNWMWSLCNASDYMISHSIYKNSSSIYTVSCVEWLNSYANWNWEQTNPYNLTNPIVELVFMNSTPNNFDGFRSLLRQFDTPATLSLGDEEYSVNCTGVLEVQLIEPTGNFEVVRNQNFTLKANVTCKNGCCGSVNGFADPIRLDNRPEASEKSLLEQLVDWIKGFMERIERMGT